MSNPNHRTPENVPGPCYVDDTCIDCGQCPSIAPACFARHPVTGVSYVHHQPATPEEVGLAEEARISCPTDSIGSDGLAAVEAWSVP